MYYKVELRIYGKYFNDGFVNISNDKFEGFLTFDYISGYVTENEDNDKLLCVSIISRKFFEEDSKLEMSNMLMIFKIDEFTTPCKYKASTKVNFYEKDKMYNEIKIYSMETSLELEFIEKVSKTNLPDFEEQLEMVKEGLKL